MNLKTKKDKRKNRRTEEQSEPNKSAAKTRKWKMKENGLRNEQSREASLLLKHYREHRSILFCIALET